VELARMRDKELDGDDQMMGHGAGIGFGLGGLLALLGCILLVVGAVVLIAWAIGKVGQSSQADRAATARPATEDALQLLRLRFARGEVTADEYAAAKQTLETER
jgi:uncharacterized membrane protein